MIIKYNNYLLVNLLKTNFNTTSSYWCLTKKSFTILFINFSGIDINIYHKNGKYKLFSISYDNQFDSLRITDFHLLPEPNSLKKFDSFKNTVKSFFFNVNKI